MQDEVRWARQDMFKVGEGRQEEVTEGNESEYGKTRWGSCWFIIIRLYQPRLLMEQGQQQRLSNYTCMLGTPFNHTTFVAYNYIYI